RPKGRAWRSRRTGQAAFALRRRGGVRPLPPKGRPAELRPRLGSGPAETGAAPVEKAVKDEPRPAPPPAIVTTSDHATTGPAPAGALKPGLASASLGLPVVLSRDPALSGVVLIARPRPPRPPAEAPAEKPGERQPANASANP